MPKHAHLIYNPHAGSAVSRELWLGRIIHQLSTDRYEVSTIALQPKFDSDTLVEILAEGSDLLVAAGGDGTIRIALEAKARLN